MKTVVNLTKIHRCLTGCGFMAFGVSVCCDCDLQRELMANPVVRTKIFGLQIWVYIMKTIRL